MNNSIFDYSYHYSHWHSDTPQSRQTDIDYAKWLFQTQCIYPPQIQANVLEIGCGMGRFLLHLKEMGYSNISGIDVDESQYEIAKKDGLNVFLSDAIQFLSNDISKYHAIYAFDVLEHIEKQKSFEILKLIYNHLQDDGMLVIQVPNALSPTATYFRYIDFTHTISYTEHSLGFLLHNAGFHDFCIRPTHIESQNIQELKLP